MAKTRKLTLSYLDGVTREVTTARNYMYVVSVSKRRQAEDGTLKIYYHDDFLCGREDLMRKTVSRWRNSDSNNLIEIGILTNDPWLTYPERAKAGFKPYEMPNFEIARQLEKANK